VLPVPFAFSRMGVLLGILTMAVVAYSNSLTSVLLLRAAGLTGHDTYEGVAHAVAGPVWKARSPHADSHATQRPDGSAQTKHACFSSPRMLPCNSRRSGHPHTAVFRGLPRLPALPASPTWLVRQGHGNSEGPSVALQAATQVSLVLLLFGTVIGDFALLADVGQRALRRLSPAPPAVLVDHDGRGIMLLLALGVVLPLCLLRRRAPCLLRLSAMSCSMHCHDARAAVVPAAQAGPSLLSLPSSGMHNIFRH
jgi:hypothetical protein